MLHSQLTAHQNRLLWVEIVFLPLSVGQYLLCCNMSTFLIKNILLLHHFQRLNNFFPPPSGCTWIKPRREKPNHCGTVRFIFLIMTAWLKERKLRVKWERKILSKWWQSNTVLCLYVEATYRAALAISETVWVVKSIKCERKWSRLLIFLLRRTPYSRH